MKGYQAQGVTKDLGRGKLLARLGIFVDVWEDHCLAEHVSVQSTELHSDF